MRPQAKIAMLMPTLGNFRFYRARAKLNEIIFDLIDDARDVLANDANHGHLNTADKALYQAKQAGRNRVMLLPMT